LGRALYGQRRFQEAERVLAGLAELPLTDVQRTELAIERSDSLRGLYRYAEATGELQAAAVIVTDHGLRDRLTTCVAESLLLDGRVAEALDTVSAVLTHESTDETTFAQAVWITSWALVRAGRASEAIDIIRLQERLGSRWKDEMPRLHGVIEGELAPAYLWLGRFAEAEAVAAASYRQWVRSQSTWGIKTSAHALMTVALARGRVRTAVHWGLEGLAQVPEPGDATLLHSSLALPLALAGNLDAAEVALRKADVAGMERSRLWRLWVDQARCWIQAGRGYLSSAIQLALETADLAESTGVNDSYAVALHDAVRLGGASQVSGRLRALAREVDGPVVPLYTAHATALTAQDGTALDEVAAAFEAIGAMLLAAEAAAAAATAHRARGRGQAARASAVRATALADRCEGVHTPALRLLEQPPELTPGNARSPALSLRGCRTGRLPSGWWYRCGRSTTTCSTPSTSSAFAVDGNSDASSAGMAKRKPRLSSFLLRSRIGRSRSVAAWIEQPRCPSYPRPMPKRCAYATPDSATKSSPADSTCRPRR
jgi:tetratricopeptide (TPR) repeat protein